MVETSSFALAVLQINLETRYAIFSSFRLKLTLRGYASVIWRTPMSSSSTTSSWKELKAIGELGTIAASEPTFDLLVYCSRDCNNLFIIQLIWRSHGERYIIDEVIIFLVNFAIVGILNEPSWPLAYKWLSDNYKPGDCIFLFGEWESFVMHTVRVW